MRASIQRLADAVRRAATNKAMLVAQVAEVVDVHQLAAMREQQVELAQAAELLAHLAPHERLTRVLAQAGALTEFPTYSLRTDVLLTDGMYILIRTEVVEDLGSEVKVKIVTGNYDQRVLIARKNILGVETINRLVT